MICPKCNMHWSKVQYRYCPLDGAMLTRDGALCTLPRPCAETDSVASVECNLHTKLAEIGPDKMLDPMNWGRAITDPKAFAEATFDDSWSSKDMPSSTFEDQVARRLGPEVADLWFGGKMSKGELLEKIEKIMWK